MGRGGQDPVTVSRTMHWGSMHMVGVLAGAGVGQGGVRVDVTVIGQDGELVEATLAASPAGMARAADRELVMIVSCFAMLSEWTAW